MKTETQGTMAWNLVSLPPLDHNLSGTEPGVKNCVTYLRLYIVHICMYVSVSTLLSIRKIYNYITLTIDRFNVSASFCGSMYII